MLSSLRLYCSSMPNISAFRTSHVICFLVFGVVKLNLFNYVLALFRVKFSCNSAFRNPVFRWKYCKGCMCESVKI